MFIKKIRGLKYPDVEIVRWFFKSKIYESPKRKVLELGSSNGNNLSLFAEYGFKCLGVELDENNVKNAEYNFNKVMKYKKARFFAKDMCDFVKNNKNIKAGVFLIPNVINFISKQDFENLLINARANKLYTYEKDQFSYFFLRARSVRDYRYGKGKQVNSNSFILDDPYVGEQDCLCTCYQDYELVELLEKHLNLYDFELLTSENINTKDSMFIKDSDIIIYGKIS